MKLFNIGTLVALAFMATGCQIPQDDSVDPSAYNCSPVYGAGDVREAPASIFVFAGQSNMVGLGKSAELPPHEKLTSVVVWVNDHWETYQEGSCFGPDRSFAINWQRDHPNEVVGFIKHAVGGTSMGDWQVNYNSAEATYPQAGPLYSKLVSKYNDAGNLPVRGFIWVQGESDASVLEAALAYADRIKFFITNVRSIMNNAPFVMAETANFGAPYWVSINNTQNELVSLGYVDAKVPATDLPVFDGLHFNTYGQTLLGNRLYDAWVATQR